MSPHCQNCGAHVSQNYHRVRAGNDGKLHACPNCCNSKQTPKKAAGIDPDYEIRSDGDGLVIPRSDD